MSAFGEIIAAAANDMVGTPFRHQGRSPKTGVDCVGVVLCSVWSAGCDVPDCLGYGPVPKSEVLLEQLGKRAERVHLDDAEPGDILLFQYSANMPLHFAMLVEDWHMVHAHRTTAKVVKHRMTRAWASRLHSIWRVTHG